MRLNFRFLDIHTASQFVILPNDKPDSTSDTLVFDSPMFSILVSASIFFFFSVLFPRRYFFSSSVAPALLDIELPSALVHWRRLGFKYLCCSIDGLQVLGETVLYWHTSGHIGVMATDKDWVIFWFSVQRLQ